MPAIPSWLLEPLWDQFAALLPSRPVYHPAHPLGCHRPRIPDRIIFEKLVQVLRFGCSYEQIADCTCSATTIRDRRNEWNRVGGGVAPPPLTPPDMRVRIRRFVRPLG